LDLQNSYLLDCDVDDSAPLSTGEVEDSNSPPLVKLKTRTLLRW
jgi:hypothetical protein